LWLIGRRERADRWAIHDRSPRFYRDFAAGQQAIFRLGTLCADSPAAAMPSVPTRLFAHLDMDAFYASVELLRYPELKGRPVVIGGGRRHQPQWSFDPVTGQPTRSFATLRDYAGRGVATTATYEARAFGVHSAMGLMKAAKLAPDAVLLPVDFDAYRKYSRLFKNAVRAIAPRIQDNGIDEIYIDLTDVHPQETGMTVREAALGVW